MADALSDRRLDVILCEGYDSLREGLEFVLGGHYRVASVRHLAELSSLLGNITPALFVIDIDDQSKPYEVLRRIRGACPSVPFLLLSREFSLEQQLEAVQFFTNVGFMHKPFSMEPLLEKAQVLIQGYSSSPVRRHILRVRAAN